MIRGSEGEEMICEEKKKYRTYAEAKKMRRRYMLAIRKRSRPAIFIYKCPHCDYYHFTSDKQWRENEKRR